MTTDLDIVTFVVDEGGAVSVQHMTDPETRGDCLGLELSSDHSIREVMYFVDEGWRPKAVVARAYLDKQQIDGDPEEIEKEELEEWLRANPENVTFALERLSEWLADTLLDEEDYDAASLLGNDPYSAALRFWRDGDLNPRDFGIVVVEGEFPGSSYYAAELRKPIEYANEVAIKLHAPVRFIRLNKEILK